MIGRRTAAAAGMFLALAGTAAAQPLDPSRKWEILDNSFLVEESFNQERGVFQNIFTWTRQHDGDWGGSFTQEWPAPSTRHQLSYTVPFGAIGGTTAFGDVLLNYRYQLRDESPGGPAISPRASVILPTGRAEGFGGNGYGVQFNVPASKQFGDLYVHANAGYAWVPDIESATAIAGSAIWRARPMFNVMLEAVFVVDESATVSPGFRRGWNFDDRQLVVGVAVPLTRQDGETHAALLAYASYELPFRK
jgi:hypothetical protein